MVICTILIFTQNLTSFFNVVFYNLLRHLSVKFIKHCNITLYRNELQMLDTNVSFARLKLLKVTIISDRPFFLNFVHSKIAILYHL